MNETESGDEKTEAQEILPPPEAEVEAPSVLTASLGEWLRRAREQRGLSPHQVASDLHLDTQVINAIEINRFQDMGAPVYAKGYLRRYARLVGLSEDEALSRYDGLSDTPRTANPIPAAYGMIPAPARHLPPWVKWVIGGLAALVIAVVVVNAIRTSEDVSNESVLQSTVSSTPLASLPTPATVPVDAQDVSGTNNGYPSASPVSTTGETPLQLAGQLGSAASASVPVPLSASGPAVAGSATTLPANPAPAGAPGPVTMQLRFTGNSWVEIYGANNQTLLYNMGSPDNPRELSGTPPWRVTLGSANAVQVSINGKAYAIPASKIQANVAHFNVNAAGQVE